MGYVRAYVFILVPAFFCETAVYCASIPTSSQSAQSKPKGFGTAKRAVIIGVDGLGGAHLRNVTDHYPIFRSFFEHGSYTTRARGVFPTSSGPNWCSYLTGLNVMEHGVFNNSWNPANGNPDKETSYSIPPVTGRGRPQTIFSQVKKKDPNLQVENQIDG
ncbi:nucleotide pyrophosphatase [Paramuricea clavata]|uniref:Nucleotide pyrophosphatase n=1 Tax=Paramuricea clavata TaxID=317549 RepID=A0A6S7HTD9_PARCT|nr:nucleotide pyrophosphatase [Paramuricea clavata]